MKTFLKKITLILVFIFMFTYYPQEPEAIVGLAAPKIGGRITYYNPICRVPSAVNFSTISPGIGTGMWMFVWGASFSYAYTPPAHPGQPILGLGTPTYSPCLIPCTFGLCWAGPGGSNVAYSGTGV